MKLSFRFIYGYFRINILLVLCLMLSACYYFQKTSVPIKHIVYNSPEIDSKTKNLMILLPGIGDNAKAFEQHGFIDVFNREHKNFDAIAVEAHFKYYQERSVVERIHNDLILPALEKGYENIYIAGISLGGLGALLYLKYYPEVLEGVVVIAPFLGKKQEYEYLLNSNRPKPNEFEIGLWPWIEQLSPATTEKIYLAYGRQDKFSEANTLFATYLPEKNTYSIEGGHSWKTWKHLWPETVFRLLR